MAFDNFTLGGFNMGQMMAGQQGNHLAGMINQTTGAIGKENDSRVAQQREMRRMDHEINLKKMELDAILKRIEAARAQADSGPKPRVSFRGGAIY
jgi:hypothetical protein